MITVLRLGHRPGRDSRISTHVGLVARAFGASSVVYSGLKDEKMMSSVRKVSEGFGGEFSVTYAKDWRNVVERFDGLKVHLTMYGEPFETKIAEIKKAKNVLIVVGGEKVPGEIYGLADANVSVTKQPHSEVAALAVVLYEATH
ncbi:MAG: tRNA (cytidine(56)-2'-O)-methyltransferase [Candidatus Aenigmatarchaeota archaeon]|nr:MAG: tRNA (cytidine(56)-2'-O)-methyltransferase [Candidatus Aenigmarchaeota archaeon]